MKQVSVGLVAGAVAALTLGILQRIGLNFWLALLCGLALSVVVGLIFRQFQKEPPATRR